MDTNVFAYALDQREPAKQTQAVELIDERRSEIVVSTQVLVELYAVCVRKLAMERGEARAAVEAVAGFPVTDTDRGLILRALALSESAQLSIFDASIVCAAQRSGCTTLFTEDLQDRQRFGDVVVRNPFAR